MILPNVIYFISIDKSPITGYITAITRYIIEIAGYIIRITGYFLK